MIHHSAVSHAVNKDQFRANNKYHKAKWNFKSSLGYYLGYNYEISANGKTRQARKEGERTAACYQSNMNDGRCIHICLDGNFDIEKPTAKQIFALRDLLKKIVKKYGDKKSFLVYHSDYAPKTCPGKYLQNDKDFIKKLAWEVIEQPEVPDLKVEINKILIEASNKIFQLIK